MRPLGTGPSHVLAPHCETLSSLLSEVSGEFKFFKQTLKTFFISFGICLVNQFVYSDFDVLFSLSLSALSVMFSVFQLLLAL